MAIKAIIATQFDATGLKKATSEFGKLGNTIKGTLGAVGLTVGLSALTSTLKQATQQASNDNKAQILLAQQLRNTADASDVQIASVEEAIAKMSIQAAVADDKLRPALASLVRATGDVGQAQNLLSLSLDVSAATGKDLQSVSLAIGKAVAGQTSQLFRMIPALKGSDDWMGKLRESTKGMAEAAGNADPFMRLQIIFDEIQETIGFAVLPALQDFSNWMASAEGQAKVQEFVDVLVSGVEVLVNFSEWIGENIDWLGQLAIGVAATTTAVGLFNLALNTNPIMLAVTAIGLLVTAMLALNKAAGISTSGVPTAINAAAVKAGQNAYDKAMRDKSNFEQTSTGPKLKTGAAMVAERARTAAYDKAIADYKKSIQKANSSIKVPTPSLGNGIFPSVTDTKSGGKTAAQKAAEKAAAALKKAKEAFAVQLKQWEEAKAAYDEQVRAINDYKDSLKSLLPALQPLAVATREIGQFEQTSIDAFDAIAKSLDEGLANGVLTAQAASNLKNYAKVESAILNELGRKRDALVEKRSLATALIADVKSALIGTGSLAGLLETQTRQVTETVTKVVNGFAITTKRTVDEVVGGKGVVSRLKDVVAKTKAFAGQLTDLKRLGLSPDLFKQIVEAGPDVGGQLATEILTGGADSVQALNDTFSELQAVAGTVAEQTAVVMYNSGIDVAGGLVNGLLAQEQALVSAAQTLADAFTAEFNARMAALVIPTLADPGPAPVFNAPVAVTPKVSATVKNIAPKVTIKATPSTKADAQKVASALNKFYATNTGAKVASGKFVF